MDYPWVAYVPFARVSLQGELGGRSSENKNPESGNLASGALPFIHGAIFFIFYIILWAVGIGALISAMNSYSGPGVGSVIAPLVAGVVCLSE